MTKKRQSPAADECGAKHNAGRITALVSANTMTETNVERLYKMGCGVEILNSCIERTKISCAISNCNTSIKYAKKCLRYYKETQEDHWLLTARVSLAPDYYKLLAIEPLADKYDVLWKEKFCKTKLASEKIFKLTTPLPPPPAALAPVLEEEMAEVEETV